MFFQEREEKRGSRRNAARELLDGRPEIKFRFSVEKYNFGVRGLPIFRLFFMEIDPRVDL